MAGPWRRRLLAVSWTVLALGVPACAEAPDAHLRDPRSLAGPWAFHPGDDPAWAGPGFDDSGWGRIRVPGSWRRQGFDQLTGIAWYRRRVPAAWAGPGTIGVTLGKIDSAYELYVGGRHLGGVGALPPSPRMEYDRHATYTIPAEAREPDGSLVLALRVWREPRKRSSAAGPVEGPFAIGPVDRLLERQQVAEARTGALLLLFALLALYNIGLRVQLGSGSDYLWFGILALLTALYGFLRTQWKYLVLDDFVVLKKVEHLVIWLLPAVATQFLWVFFKEPRPRWLRAVQLLLVAGALVVTAAPGVLLPLALLPILDLVIGLLVAATLWLLARRIRAGDREAVFVGLGMAVLGTTSVYDGLVDRNYIVGPRLAVHGFAFLVVGMSLTLGNRFQRALRERDALTRELEARVAARTQELSVAYQQMKELALRDGLTKLLNRGAIRERALGEIARARREGTAFAVALVDIDHFKSINDTLGHAAGDQVIVQVARRLAEAVRTYDDVGRWGGEEFVVLLPGTDRGAASAAGERLRAAIAALPMTIEDAAPRAVTVSIGVMATGPGADGAIDLDSIVARADEALYRAKADGRNAARVADALAS